MLLAPAIRQLTDRLVSFNRFLYLLLAQALAGVLAIVFSSGRLEPLSSGVVVTTLSFIQWQIFGVTLAKFGMDQVAFSAAGKNPAFRSDAGRFSLTFAAPSALMVALASLSVFSIPLALAIFVTLIIDVYSVIKVAEHNGKRDYLTAIVAAFFNYPFFYISIILAAYFFPLTDMGVALAFVTASFLRFVFILAREAKFRASSQSHSFVISYSIVIQQLLNYFLFRGDQILIGYLHSPANAQSSSRTVLQEYLYFAKFPEILSGFFVAAASFIFVGNFLRSSDLAREDALALIRSNARLILLVSVSIVLMFIAYSFFYKHDELPALAKAAFILQAILILPVNLATYSMMREERIGAIVENLGISLAIALSSALLIFWLAPAQLINWLSWLVAAQMGLFIFLCLHRSWGTRKAMYAA